jgi:hypothetical protein
MRREKKEIAPVRYSFFSPCAVVRYTESIFQPMADITYRVLLLRSHPTRLTPMLPSKIAPGAGIGVTVTLTSPTLLVHSYPLLSPKNSLVAVLGMVMFSKLDPITNACCSSGLVISDTPKVRLDGALSATGAASVKNTPSNAFKLVLSTGLIPKSMYA